MNSTPYLLLDDRPKTFGIFLTLYLLLDDRLSSIFLAFSLMAFCFTTPYDVMISICHVGEGAIGLTQSDPEGDKFGSMEAACEKGTSSETMKQRIGRPKKILKQTNDSISDRDKGSHQEHIEAKEEVDICGGKDLTHLKTLERTEAQNSTMITKEVNNNDTAEKNLSKIEGDNSDLVTGTGLHKQENSRLTEVSEKATFSTGYKFYKRRSCNKT
jgi:hypothetical protein